MKAAVIESAGETPRYLDFADPVPGEGRELVSLVATGIHPIVRAIAAGTHYGSAGRYPSIPGVDAVARTADDALVYTGYVTPPYGTIAERMSVPAGMRLTVPAAADPVQVAAAMNPGLSSWMPLVARAAQLQASRPADAEDGGLGTVLVLGATGTAGILAVQNALALGASRVIAAGRSAERLRLAEDKGADVVAISGDRAADASALRDALGTSGASIVLDFVWGEPAEAAFDALSRSGLEEDHGDTAYIEIGQSAGAEASLPASLLRSTSIRISGSGAGSGSIAELMQQLPVYLGLIADGTVRVPVEVVALRDVETGWRSASRAGVRTVIVP